MIHLKQLQMKAVPGSGSKSSNAAEATVALDRTRLLISLVSGEMGSFAGARWVRRLMLRKLCFLSESENHFHNLSLGKT